ncbi:MAG: hypothetical protein SPI25_01070 [Dialister sp.]|nr:hypothetical protein [Dialister sp.]
MTDEGRINGWEVEDLYRQIEEAISASPAFFEFTTNEFSDIVHGISRVFGRRPHKGIVLRREKGRFRADISLSVFAGNPVLETVTHWQNLVAEIIRPYAGELPVAVNIAVTGLVENEE